MRKLIVLLLVLGVVALGYYVHMLLKKYVDPRRSALHLLAYFAGHLAAVFLILFLFKLFLLHFRVWLFS